MNRGPGERVLGTPGGGVLFRVEDLRKSFDVDGKEVSVLKGVDLEVRAGETLAILGASGVGKTTLLHILGALDQPSEGRVLYRGEPLGGKSERDLAAFRNREVGFVFQFHYLLADLTALENVALPAWIAGVPRRAAERRAGGLLEELGLSDRAAHRPGRLSGGEQQRVAIARSMILEPRVILADEPTGNLDTRTAAVVEDVLLGLRASHGVSLVAVTHNPAFASRMDRRLRMVDGRMMNDARPASDPGENPGGYGNR